MAPSRTGTPRTATPKGSPKPATPKTATPTGSTLGAASLGITGSKPPTRTGTALRTGVSVRHICIAHNLFAAKCPASVRKVF